jgi:hypothetical protein
VTLHLSTNLPYMMTRSAMTGTTYRGPIVLMKYSHLALKLSPFTNRGFFLCKICIAPTAHLSLCNNSVVVHSSDVVYSSETMLTFYSTAVK